MPEGLEVIELPELEWAKFKAIGLIPKSIQAINRKVFEEWLPGNPEYEIAYNANIEWYSDMDTKSINYESAVWIPIKKKS